MCHYAQLWNLDVSPTSPSSPPSLPLSTLIWEIFLQIFNIFLLQLFHEENHEILRSWRYQWGSGSDHLGGEEKEDRHQEVGRSQGITDDPDSGTIPLSVFNHDHRVTEKILFCYFLLVFLLSQCIMPSQFPHSYSSQNGINSSEMHFCTLWCVQVSQLAKKNRF